MGKRETAVLMRLYSVQLLRNQPFGSRDPLFSINTSFPFSGGWSHFNPKTRKKRKFSLLSIFNKNVA